MRFLAYPEDSLKFLQEGERLCKELDDKKSLVTLYHSMSLFYSLKGDPALGKKYQRDSFEEAEKIQDIEIMAPSSFGLCFSNMVEGNLRELVNIATKTIALFEKTQREHEFFGLAANPYSTVQAFCGLSTGALGKFAEGERLCEKALSFAHKINHLYSIGTTELAYGVLFLFKGDGENVIKHFQSCIEYLEKSQAANFLPLAWAYLGWGYYFLGELNTALEFIEKGLKMQMDIGMAFRLSNIHYALSLVHFDLNNLNEAKLYAEQALNLARTNHEKWFEGLSWLQLGRTVGKIEKSQIDKAEEHILKGMKTLDELEIKSNYSEGLFFLGELYANAGQKEKALENLKKAEALFQEMGMDYWLARTKKLLDMVRI